MKTILTRIVLPAVIIAGAFIIPRLIGRRSK